MLIAFVASARNLICFPLLRSCGWILIYCDGADDALQLLASPAHASGGHVVRFGMYANCGAVSESDAKSTTVHEEPVAKSDASDITSATNATNVTNQVQSNQIA